MTSCATLWKQWASPLFAAVAILLLATTSVLSVAHPVDSDAHTLAATSVFELIETGESGEPNGSSAYDIAICLHGLMCDATLAFLGNAEGTPQAPFSPALQLPSPDTLRDGQSLDVLTPPPNPKRA